MTETFIYDVFLSHGAKDKAAARELAERLKGDGLRVWLAEWELAPRERATSKREKIELGLASSRVLVCCISRNITTAEWNTLGDRAVRFGEPANQQRRLIPLRMDDAEIKRPVDVFESLDYREESAEQYRRLLSACLASQSQTPAPARIDPERIISLGHTGAVRSLAVSPDGRFVFSSSEDKTVCVWEVSTGRCINILEGHTRGINSVALSPDGLLAFSGSSDNTVRVWEVSSGRCIDTLEGHTHRVFSVALSPDGHFAFSASSDKTVRVWEVSTGRCIDILEGHTDSVWSVALSPDGLLAFSGSDDKTVRVWEVSTGRCINTLEGHTRGINSVALSRDGLLAISGSSDKTVRVWEVSTGRCINTLGGHTYSVLSVALSPDGRFAFSGSDDKTVRVWEVSTGRCINTLADHTDSVWSVALSPDGRFAFSASSDKTVRVWEVSIGRCINTLEGHTDSVLSVALSPDGHFAFSASSDKTVRVWEVSTGRCINTLEGHTHSVWSVALSPDCLVAFSGSSDKTVRVWEVSTGRCINTLEGHTSRVRSIALSPDGLFVFSGSTDRTVRVWKVSTGRCINTLEGHTESVLSVALSPDGLLAFSGSSDKTVRVWEVSSGRCIDTLEGHTDSVFSVALSPDGHFAFSASSDKTVRVWEVSTGRCIDILEGHTDSVWSVALSPDGLLAFSGSDDKTVRVWEVSTGRCINTLEGHTSGVWSVALSPDGRHMLSSAINGVARLWSMEKIQAAAISAPRQDALYTNAKVVLVGESGVGKTGLALRLCEDRWEPTESTHGMTISRIAFGAEEVPSDVEREVWLWDFAGQPDYRLIHQLYMDETALGVLVFDPQDDNPFDALGHWEKALQIASKARGLTPAKLLVAARCDRGGITVSKRRFDDFCREHGFEGLWITGAKTADGCEELKDAIARHIPWERLTNITTTRLFKSLKDALLKLREEDTPLVRLPELRKRLQLMLPDEKIETDSLRTVVGLMEGQGVVKTLDFGDFVLLQPEHINRYASVAVRMAREHLDEMGVVPEQQVLDGRLDYMDMKRLAETDEKILLRAMVQTFLDRAFALRETTPAGTMLVFPSYFRRDKPEVTDYPNVFVTYGFAGPLDEIYATLVVKLNYSEGFNKDQLWKDAADFKTPGGKRVGLAMRKKAEGAAELVVYFEPGVPDDTKVMFIKYVHEHLLARAQHVTRVRLYVCPHCDTPLENRKAIEIRLKKGNKDIVCSACEERVVLIDLIEEKFASDEFARRVREMDEKARINLDNESRELILVGHAFAIAGEAGQIYRQYTNSDHGIDGEIEFKDHKGKASGMRLYLQLKSGDSYLSKRKRDDMEIFTIKKERWAEYWQKQAYPVMLVIRTSDGKIRWMNVTEYLKQHSEGGKQVKQIVFEGEDFAATNLQKMRDRMLRLML